MSYIIAPFISFIYKHILAYLYIFLYMSYTYANIIECIFGINLNQMLVIISIKIRKMKVFILYSFNSSLRFFLILCRSEFLSYIILPSKELVFTFLARTIIQATNFLNFFDLWMSLFFIFEGWFHRIQISRLLGVFFVSQASLSWLEWFLRMCFFSLFLCR